MVYKHTILPYAEYAGYMLTSCTIDDKSDLQKCQNDALRICTRRRLADHIRISDLHKKCKIVSLEQRRRMQFLSLVYKKSKDLTLRKVFPRNKRESVRLVFKTDQYEGALYKRSPYFIGSKLWDALPISDIECPDIFSFRKHLRTHNRVYLNLL